MHCLSKSKVGVAILVLVVCMLLAIQARAENLRDIKNAPMERQLAFLDMPGGAGKSFDLLVARFRSLLDQLIEKHSSENDYDIGNWTVQIQQAMEKNGIEESSLNIMEGVNSLNPGPRRPLPTYKECATAYAALRVQGKSRRAAVAILPGYIKALRAEGTIKK